MKMHHAFRLWVAVILLFLQVHDAYLLNAAEAGALAELAQQEVRVCAEQMRRIHEGIVHFYLDNKRLPRFLSDLFPKYCRTQDFTCPAKGRVGDQAWARQWLFDEALHDPKLEANTYAYEFTDKLWRGTTVTYLDYKNAQRDYLGLRFGQGDSVPILRCFMHGRTNVLNFTFGGKFVTSGLEWEEKFELHHDELTVDALLPKVQVKLDGEFPPRPPGLGPELLDLAANYNAVINKSWYKFPTSPEVSFGRLLEKPKFLRPVEFDVRGVIQLKGGHLDRPFPLKSEGIRVRQLAQRLHFLLGAYGKADYGEKIAQIRLNFGDQPPSHFDIEYGIGALDWRVDPAEITFSEINKKVIWKGEGLAENGKVEPIRLYHFQRPNPRADKEILSIDFEVTVTDSVVSRSAPALFAITLEP